MNLSHSLSHIYGERFYLQRTPYVCNIEGGNLITVRATLSFGEELMIGGVHIFSKESARTTNLYRAQLVYQAIKHVSIIGRL